MKNKYVKILGLVLLSALAIFAQIDNATYYTALRVSSSPATATNVLTDGQVEVEGTLFALGAVTITGALTQTGLLTADGGITLGAQQTLSVPDSAFVDTLTTNILTVGSTSSYVGLMTATGGISLGAQSTLSVPDSAFVDTLTFNVFEATAGVSAGTGTYTGTELADTVLVTGAAAADLYLLTWSASIESVETIYAISKVGTLISNRAQALTSAPTYTWLRIRQ